MKYRRDPFGNFFEIQKQIDQLFDAFIDGHAPGGQPTAVNPDQQFWRPPMDVYEAADAFIVRVELPGVDPDDEVEIELTENVLTIRGTRRDRSREKKQHYHLAEINYGNFERAVALPEAIDDDGALAANYDDGFLEITLPKVEPPVSKTIPVQTKQPQQPITIDAEEPHDGPSLPGGDGDASSEEAN
jgi:HSP20 family protein